MSLRIYLKASHHIQLYLATAQREMPEIQLETKAQMERILKEYFIVNITDRILGFQKMCIDVRAVFADANLDNSTGRATASQQIRELVDNQYLTIRPLDLREEFPSYYYSVESLLVSFPRLEQIVQHDERYVSQPSDAGVIKLVKGLKRTGRSIAHKRIGFANLFRKSKREKGNAIQKVPTRNVARHFLVNELSRRISANFQTAEAKLLSKLMAVFELSNQLAHQSSKTEEPTGNEPTIKDFDGIIEGFSRLIEDLNKEAKMELYEVFSLTETALAKVGTLELNASFFDNAFTEVRFNKVSSRFSRFQKRISRNHRIIKNNWLLSHELHLFYERLRLDSQKLCDRLNKKVHRHLLKQVGNIESFLQESKDPFAEIFNDKKLLHDAVLKERTRINGAFKKEVIPNSTRMMLFQNLPSVTLALEQDFQNSLDLVNEATTVKKDFKADDKLSERDLNVINPREIIKRQYFSAIRKAREALHGKLVEINNRIQPAIIEISNVHAYTFETAKNNYETGSGSLKETQEAIAQGFERTHAKIEELKNSLLNVAEVANTSLDVSLAELSEKLLLLNDADNAIELNIRLVELKALDKTKGYYQSITQELRKNLKMGWIRLVKWFRYLLTFYKTTEKTLSNTRPDIDKSIKLYLTYAKTSFDKLPFIYRLLFRLEPLEDFNFYVSRKKELKELNLAYQNWDQGNDDSVLLIGPKGSGLSTLFNYFVQDHIESIQVNRISPNNNISTPEELMELLRSVFNQTKFENVEDVATYLVDCGFKRIVAVDELQRFFLRKIHGFQILNELQKLIRLTDKQVFWVVNISQMSSQYLKKTSRIHEFFSWNIGMGFLSDQDIKNLILKRHDVSGFKLVFADEISGNTKKLKKMDHNEKHEYLKALFFEKLAKSSEGSLSLALLQWSLAATLSDKQTIHLDNLISVKEILGGLDNVKASILHALMLHDGLSVKELIDVLRYDTSHIRSHLASMEKDGIIEPLNDFIKINPLLHWSGIRVLTKRNLIH